MGIFTRRQTPQTLPVPAAPTPVDLNQALEIVLVNSVKSQAETAAAIGQAVVGQLQTMSEIQQALFSMRRVRNGGRKRAATAVRDRGRFAKAKTCRLCANPSISNPTRQEILDHVNHENPGINYRDLGNHVEVDAEASQIQRGSDGAEVIECEDCANGKEHSHVVN